MILKIIKKSIHDTKLIAQDAVRFDKWVILQKLKIRYFVKTGGSIDHYREKKIVKRSRGILGIKILNGLVGEKPQYVTFTGNYCFLKGKLIDIVKMFALQDGILEDSVDHSLFTKDI